MMSAVVSVIAEPVAHPAAIIGGMSSQSFGRSRARRSHPMVLGAPVLEFWGELSSVLSEAEGV